MRVLVTGAAGFVGQHLCQELHDAGHTVIPSDKADADLAVPYKGELLVRRSKADYVVHLAARYGRLLCRDEPHLAVSDNTASTVELAAACAQRDIPVLYTSSSEVYGDHGIETITEESPLRMPTTIYGLSKRWGEEALQLYLRPSRLCIARMNMLYGPGQLGGYGRCSLATFIDNAVQGKPFTVHVGTTRAWLYITDAVRALRLLIEGEHRGVYNVGSPVPPRPMTEIAKLVCGQTGGKAEVGSPPGNQIRHKNYDVSKLRETIDWEPAVEIAEGVKATISWARGVPEVAA